MDWKVASQMCFVNMFVSDGRFLWCTDGVSRVDVLGSPWVALILTAAVVVTWNSSFKTLTLIFSLSLSLSLWHTNIHLTFFHSYRHSSWVLWTFSSCQQLPCVSRAGNSTWGWYAPHFSKKKKKKCQKKMVSNERDNVYLLYSSTSSPLLFLVPLSGR